MDEGRGLLRGLIGDGRPALSLTAVALLISGVFAIFLSFRREFLPHDVSYLGMSAAELCRFADCRVVRFMFHDRVAFGGTLIAIAVLYLWLAAFPLRQGAAWGWWAFVASGTLGFASFLAYLGYGYLDMWHGTATLALLPTFTLGLLYSRRLATAPATPWIRTEEMKAAAWPVRLGRWGLLVTGLGIGLAGLVILYLGSTEVFVAEDLGFMGVTRQMLDDVNPRLVPLIAHDRAGFGGGLATIGVLLTVCAVYSRPSRSFHEAVAIAGVAGFGCAIGTHYVEGYVNPIHLAPAFAGAALFGVSIGCEIIASRTGKSSGRTAAAAVERVVRLRNIESNDLPIFYEQQLDPDATRMAAFPARDRAAFDAHWATKILGNPAAVKQTILVDGQVAGNIGSWPQDDVRLVGYWIGKEYWGKGVATQALAAFLHLVTERPLHAHVANHNVGSIRVLEKCGFSLEREESVGEAGKDVAELVLVLR